MRLFARGDHGHFALGAAVFLALKVDTNVSALTH